MTNPIGIIKIKKIKNIPNCHEYVDSLCQLIDLL